MTAGVPLLACYLLLEEVSHFCGYIPDWEADGVR